MQFIAIIITSLFTINCVNSAKILCVFYFPSYSHQIVYQPIWKELSLRGHQVTVMTPNPLNDPNLVNLTEIDVSYTYKLVEESNYRKRVSKDLNSINMIHNLFELTAKIVESQFQDEQFQKLINDKNLSLDLIIVECHYPAVYGLSERFNAPIIGIGSVPGLTMQNKAIGNINHPILFPDMLLGVDGFNLTFLQRVKTLIFYIIKEIYYEYYLMPRAHRIASKYLKTEKYIADLQNNVSLMLYNVNPFLYPPRPDVPSVIEFNQIHIKEMKSLPDDLQKVLDESHRGVVYFSLGTNVRSDNLSNDIRTEIVKAFADLPYTILWKWESDYLPDKPDNVIIRKWFPQQDVLAHKNIKVFLTQGGLQSIEEAISRDVPLIGLPFIVDQPYNIERIVNLGIGIHIDPNTLTRQVLKAAIIEVAENLKYKQKIQEINKLLKDEPMKGLEKVVWWCEFVIRHKGNHHLRSPFKDISLINYLLLDIIAALIIFIVIITWSFYKLYTKFVVYKSKIKIS